MTDPIADMLTRIRNASIVRKTEVRIPFSKLKFEIAKLLKLEGFVEAVENEKKSDLSLRGHLVIKLKYGADGKPVIHEIKRVSKPGQRYYSSRAKLPRMMSGLGTAIVSTSQGILSDRQARKSNTGGEVLCYIW